MQAHSKYIAPDQTWCEYYDDCFTCFFPECFDVLADNRYSKKRKTLHAIFTAMTLAYQGLKTKEIAERLGKSPQIIHRYLTDGKFNGKVKNS